MNWFLAGVATVALTATSAIAQPGNSNGKGNGNGGKPAHAQQDQRGNGNGNGNGNGARADRGDRGNGNGQAIMREQRDNRGNGNGSAAMRVERGNGNGNGNANADRGNRGNGNAKAAVDRVQREVQRRGNEATRVVYDRDTRDYRDGRYNDGRYDYRRYDGPDRYIDRDWYDRNGDRGGYYGVIEGCPPGLAKKNNGCRPPGQAKKDTFLRRADYTPDWWGLSGYRDDRYRYDSGYLYRLGSGGGIASYIPLLGGALGLGDVWPTNYGYSNLSPYYVDYYDLGRPDYYRYANNVVYRLDPETSAITSIAALLTGDDWSVGQRMPSGYDVYNVPYSYRDRYYDTPQSMYRYSDGYIYQMDPETRLVSAAIELLL